MSLQDRRGVPQALSVEHEDRREGVRTFNERRKPDFKGKCEDANAVYPLPRGEREKSTCGTSLHTMLRFADPTH